MKKLISIFLSIFFIVCSVYAVTELEFNTSDNEFEILNFNTNGETICKDNVRFLNQTNKELTFEVYGKKEF